MNAMRNAPPARTRKGGSRGATPSAGVGFEAKMSVARPEHFVTHRCSGKRRPATNRRSAMKSLHAEEASRALSYATNNFAKSLWRLLTRNWRELKATLTRRGERGFQKRIKTLLSKAVTSTLLNASDGASLKQRYALMYLLASASAPADLQLSGVPEELRRLRRQRGVL